MIRVRTSLILNSRMVYVKALTNFSSQAVHLWKLNMLDGFIFCNFYHVSFPIDKSGIKPFQIRLPSLFFQPMKIHNQMSTLLKISLAHIDSYLSPSHYGVNVIPYLTVSCVTTCRLHTNVDSLCKTPDSLYWRISMSVHILLRSTLSKLWIKWNMNKHGCVIAR